MSDPGMYIKFKEKMTMAFHELVDSVESFEKALKKVKEAQEIFSTYTQEQVDAIFFAAASAAENPACKDGC